MPRDRRFTRGALLALLLALARGGVATAAAPLDVKSASADPVPVYDVYVTSQRDVVTAITTTREITREDISQESARTLDEALVHQPSLIVRTGGEGSPRIDIRGLRTRQILTLIDGVPFYSSEDNAFDPSLIPTQIIERVDVTYSNSSVLYGDGPIAGIIQIRTRSGEAGLHPEAAGDFRSGSQNLGQGSIAGARGGVEGFAAGRFYDSNGWWLPESFNATALEDGDRRDNSDRQQGNAFAKAGYAVSDRGRVDALFNYQHAEYGVPWRVEQQTAYVGRARFERVEREEGFTGQLSGQLQASERVSLRSWGFVNRQSEDRSSFDNQRLNSQLTRDVFDLEGTTLVGGGALHGRIDGGALGALRLAVNGRREQFDSEGRIRDVNLGGGNFGFRSIDQRDAYSAWSLGGEYELKPLEAVGVTLGYAHAFLDGDGGVDDDGSLFLAGAYWDLPTRTRLRGSAAHKLRFPSLQQLYAANGGNGSLDSERCWCFEAGISQPIGETTTFGITGFWLELRDFIERNDNTNVFQNRQELESRGVELELLSSPWAPLTVRTAYTYLDAHDRSSGSPFDRLENRPRHKVDAEARVRFPTDTTFRAALSYLADNLVYTRNAPFLTDHLDDFAIVDLRLEQELLDDRLQIYFGVDNVGDAQSEINIAFPQAGRTYFGGFDL
ncbi:MAG TPA: TonB-dependent receptor plug domain-containing protein, partial [Myxococcota bacterium]|nr:TonB-dependent receptor plug domain-containing protein [Myxococcota bacterium]